MDVYQRLKELGIELPSAPGALGLYTQVMPFADGLAYMSGCGPLGVCDLTGKLGSELTLEQGQQAARAVAINMLAVLHRDLGDLNRVEKLIKLLGFVASAPDFYDQPQVVNGASQLFIDVFGAEHGKPARSAIAAPCLPGNIPVEIELLLKLKD